MPSGVRFNLADSERIRTFLERMVPADAQSVTNEALENIARAAEERAKTVEIVRGRGLKSEPLDTQLTYRSGHLTRSISTDSDPSAGVWIVGTPIVYGPVHELGLRVGNRSYPRRPFLEPAALWAIANKAEQFFRNALERASRGGGA
jgi:phage gpG-like protein